MKKEQYENERLDDLQNLVREWHNQNFGHTPKASVRSGINKAVEEVSYLKSIIEGLE